MEMLKSNIYDLTLLAIMFSFFFIFNLSNEIKKIIKLGLVYHANWKSVLLFKFELYQCLDRKSDNMLVITEMEIENSLTIHL